MQGAKQTPTTVSSECSLQQTSENIHGKIAQIFGGRYLRSEVRVCNGEVGIPGMSESWNVRLVIVVGGGGRVGGGAEIGSVAEGGGAPYCMRREVEVAGGWWVGGA